jgi:hypothetical protein
MWSRPRFCLNSRTYNQLAGVYILGQQPLFTAVDLTPSIIFSKLPELENTAKTHTATVALPCMRCNTNVTSIMAEYAAVEKAILCIPISAHSAAMLKDSSRLTSRLALISSPLWTGRLSSNDGERSSPRSLIRID